MSTRTGRKVKNWSNRATLKFWIRANGIVFRERIFSFRFWFANLSILISSKFGRGPIKVRFQRYLHLRFVLVVFFFRLGFWFYCSKKRELMTEKPISSNSFKWFWKRISKKLRNYWKIIIFEYFSEFFFTVSLILFSSNFLYRATHFWLLSDDLEQVDYILQIVLNMSKNVHFKWSIHSWDMWVLLNIDWEHWTLRIWHHWIIQNNTSFQIGERYLTNGEKFVSIAWLEKSYSCLCSVVLTITCTKNGTEQSGLRTTMVCHQTLLRVYQIRAFGGAPLAHLEARHLWHSITIHNFAAASLVARSSRLRHSQR